MSRIHEMIKELYPEGVEYVKLGEIMTIVRGASPRPIKNYMSTPQQGIHWIKIGDVSPYDKYITNTNEYISKEGAQKSRLLKAGDFILSNSMSFGRPYILKISGCIHDGWIAMSDFEGSVVPDFLYEVLRSNSIQNYWKMSANNGGAMTNLNADIVRSTLIPLPPLSIQQEIVSVLDSFTTLIDKMKQEVEKRKKQIEYYREKLLTFEEGECEWKTLGEVTEIGTGSGNTNEGLEEGLYPFYTRGQEILRKNTFEFDEEAIVTAGDGVGVGKVMHYVKGKYALHQRAYRFNPKEGLSAKYLYYYMQVTFYKYVCGNAVASSVSSLRKPKLQVYPIPIPPLSKQLEIVSILDKFESYISKLEKMIALRQKQYEYYREQLLTFE